MIDKVIKYFECAKNISAVYLFGSYAKGKHTKDSDLDIAILFEDYDKVSDLDVSLKLSADLMQRIKFDEVDIVVLNSANPILKYQIYKYGKKLLDMNPSFTRCFREQSIIEYLDFAFVRGVSEQMMKRKILMRK